MADAEFTPEEISRYYSTRVPQLKQRPAGEWRGPCPIHHGKKDNFAVNPSTGLWYCHSTCGRGGDILELEQTLTGNEFACAMVDAYRVVGRLQCEAPDFNGAHGSPAATTTGESAKGNNTIEGLLEIERYPYQYLDGSILFEVVRYKGPDGQKAFRQCRPNGEGGVIWNLDDVPRIPYRLPKVIEADTVYLAEGEKDVHTLEAWGLTASCNPGGANKSRLYIPWQQYFQGRNIVILPDNDAPGRKHAAAVAAILLNVAASVRIVELPNVQEKGDVTDWRNAGGTFDQFCALAESALPLNDETLLELRTRWELVNKPQHEGARIEVRSGWARPEPVQSELPPVKVFYEDLLPSSLRPLVVDVTDRMQVPMDYPAIAAVVSLAGAVNRRAVIQPKANDTGWTIVPNLWGAIIAPPGFMKSPVIQAVTRPLSDIQAEWRNEHEQALDDFAQAHEEYELRRAAWKEQYKSASKKGNPAPDRPQEEMHEPKLRRLIVNDSTFEALHQTMSENPAGILVIRDELTGWWSQLDRAGREGERAFCLQAWNGDTGHTIDRIGRGTIHVEACCMSMLGGIQPGRLRSYLVDALNDGPNNDGLIQRFQLLVWPDTAADWDYVDRTPDPVSEQHADRVFRELVKLDEKSPARFRFASDAQNLFVEWLANVERRIRANELHAALISHLSKYRSLMPSLALLFELADRAGSVGFEGSSVTDHENFVGLEHAERAVAWCEYLETHAQRVYSCIVTPQMRAARELADKIQRRKVATDRFFSCRDVYLKGWSGLDSPESVKQAADVLQDAGWVRELPSLPRPFGGRPSNKYEVNPAVWD